MSDDKTKRSPEDASKISLTEKWELDYWKNELGVSTAELQEAVRKAGNSAAAVRKQLGK